MELQKDIKRIAEIILSELDNFDKNFLVRPVNRGNVLAYSENLIAHADRARSSLEKIQSELYISQTSLQRKPFIAYIKAEINGDDKILFICKGDTPTDYSTSTSKSMFVNYYAPMGRAAEADVGNDFEFSVKIHGKEKYTEVYVIEKNKFTPVKEERWDGIKNEFYLSTGIFSIKSLFEYLEKYRAIFDKKEAVAYAEKVQELENKLIEEYSHELNIKRGISREIINKMELRNQPILDKTQGEIFRLPLSAQMIITGAPGTGKTTTIIKRIAQKSELQFITDEEKYGLNESQLSDFFNKKNWVMFTPTELLKMFLKESFSKELLPASDEMVKIWDEERRIIGRDILKFLKVGDKGIYRTTSKKLLISNDNNKLIEYTETFIHFYYHLILDEFGKAFKILQDNKTTPKLITKFAQINAKLKSIESQHIENRIFILLDQLMSARDLFNQKSKELDEIIEKVTFSIVKSKNMILEDIFEIIQSHKSESENIDEEDDYEDDYDEEQNVPDINESTIIAKRQLKRTIMWQAIRITRNDSSVRKNIHSSITELISNFLPPKDELTEIGKKIIDRRVSSVLTRGYTNILNRIPSYYHKFRMTQLKQNEILLNKDFENEIKNKMISDHEIDLLIFIVLKNAHKILDVKKDWLWKSSKINLLEEIKAEYKTLITVDEATDFSTLQLGCMFYLSHPFFKSVSFSGDLMQRVTSYGLRDWNECSYISESFQINQVDKVYRQSPKLLKIAEELYKKKIGKEPPFNSAFFSDENDPDPLQFNAQNDDYKLGEWISERIVEIYKVNNSLPSTAIFVSEDNHIDRIRSILEEPLENNSIGVEGCPEGKILSNEGKVRIFSVKYIKGLEFESVFFVNLDQIYEQLPNLVDKYLYVGLSRAASFLAVTFNTKFPEKISYIEQYFKEGDWSGFTY